MSKKTIEEVIGNAFVYVEGEQKLEERVNALDFIAHLRANEMDIPLSEGEEGFMWQITYKGQPVCYLEIEVPGTGDTALIIISDVMPASWVNGADLPMDERIKEAAWGNLRPCTSCGCDSGPGVTMNLLGKQIDKLCTSALMFDNPGGAALECVKKMVDARKKDIDGY